MAVLLYRIVKVGCRNSPGTRTANHEQRTTIAYQPRPFRPSSPPAPGEQRIDHLKRIASTATKSAA
jgi:hypothetical protein